MPTEKSNARARAGTRAGNRSGRRPATVILAIGASAAETASLVRVLAELPPDAGLAVVLALQNREALEEDRFRRALGERADALTAATDGMTAEAGRIYLAASGVILTLKDGRFGTRPAEQAPGERGTIDSFFVSLGQDQDGNTMGLVLAGTDGDGTLGITAIKEAGGLTLAEESADPEARHLAMSSGAAALADLVLPLGEIAARVALQARHLVGREEALAAEEHAADLSEVLATIAAILRDRTGHDFHGYKRNTFLRRVQRRMQVVEVDEIASYVAVLRTRPDEAQLLLNDLLIGVTQFFRDRREFGLLEAQVIPRLFEGKGRHDQVRVWVLGCSTGEEAYSIAILLREFAAGIEAPPHLQIFASDIDGRALAAARVGRYTQAIAQDMTPERLARWFVKEGNTYCVVRELREICIFSQHSIIKDTPFSRLDLVSCRNLLIYLGADLQNRVIPLFHFALRPGGFLFLGASEGVSQHAKLFAPVDRGFRIFQRVETGRRILPDFPFAAPDARVSDVPVQRRTRPAEQDLVRRAERFAERYAPAYAIVDEQFDVLHFSARAGRFIQPAGGAANLNLLNLVHGDLRPGLRGVLSTAAAEKRTARADGILMGANGQRSVVDLVVEPIQDGPDPARNFVILFKEGIALPNLGDRDTLDESALRDERVQRLDAELRVTRERLQATIEEVESTNEELKASNEEYQSLNEELQSANEELATSKEELQSVNEELTTVNGELAHRIEELGRANS
ncbi:MAG: chemotaxis protein methyltransferase, partial [Acetobacteraceae bacterium]|nr:chemotaxis protein methyltransferase [Acetobacteraceae bacterium]